MSSAKDSADRTSPSVTSSPAAEWSAASGKDLDMVRRRSRSWKRSRHSWLDVSFRRRQISLSLFREPSATDPTVACPQETLAVLGGGSLHLLHGRKGPLRRNRFREGGCTAPCASPPRNFLRPQALTCDTLPPTPKLHQPGSDPIAVRRSPNERPSVVRARPVLALRNPRRRPANATSPNPPHQTRHPSRSRPHHPRRHPHRHPQRRPLQDRHRLRHRHPQPHRPDRPPAHEGLPRRRVLRRLRRRFLRKGSITPPAAPSK